eukprot:TRINITY_DN2780_c0_g2_i1.p1 TRINITY_DN2780_c0_g2~~TRINITY_DN2780_c0_g2_i1.p1  ORF type:complete len:1560 (+),score=182.07 TRINITY_DN2780_c0_g2_i1:685-4680(+)
MPTAPPSGGPTVVPTAAPSAPPAYPTKGPTAAPLGPSAAPTASPWVAPSTSPVASPTGQPTPPPTGSPVGPTAAPTESPKGPSIAPTGPPVGPSAAPTTPPEQPTGGPVNPSEQPTASPTVAPADPTQAPVTAPPTSSPTGDPWLQISQQYACQDGPCASFHTANWLQSSPGSLQGSGDPLAQCKSGCMQNPSCKSISFFSQSAWCQYFGGRSCPIASGCKTAEGGTFWILPECQQVYPVGALLSNIAGDCPAERCIDNQTAGGDGNCGPNYDMCHSADGTNEWLRVELPTSMAVCQVIIWNRLSCCQDRLNPHEIWIGDDAAAPDSVGNAKCVDSTSAALQVVHTIAARCIGKYVFLRLGGSVSRSVSIKELQVFAEPATLSPTAPPSASPTTSPSASPSAAPTAAPSPAPTGAPSGTPSARPSEPPSPIPTEVPSGNPSARPSESPSPLPTATPSAAPSGTPSAPPSPSPTMAPSAPPSQAPSTAPSAPPSAGPSPAPSESPTPHPTGSPTASPTTRPSAPPSGHPSVPPSISPTDMPSVPPTFHPTQAPSVTPPSASPSTEAPSLHPTTASPSHSPRQPTLAPSAPPTAPAPTQPPVPRPSYPPTAVPASGRPSLAPTRVPATPPSSAAPSSSEPPTLLPSAPPTDRPPSIPPSRVPSASPTAVAPTDAPSTEPSAAPTLPPTQGHPPPPPALAAAEKAATTSSTVAALTSSGPAASALAMAADVHCSSDGAVSNLTFPLHPTGLRIADNQYLGCIVGAVAVVCGAAALSFLALGVVRLVAPTKDGVISKEGIQSSWLRNVPVIKDSEAIDIAGLVRHPNNILLVSIFVYQGAALSSLRLAASSRDLSVGLRVIGAVSAAVLLGVTVWLHRIMSSGLQVKSRSDTPGLRAPRARVRPWDDPVPPLWVQRVFVSERGDWVSRTRQNHWINRWQSGVRHFKQEAAHWGLAVEILSMWFLALAQAWSTPTYRACGHVRLMSALVHISQMLLYIWKRPYRCHRDNFFQIARLVLLASALLSLAVGFYSATDEGAASAAGSATVFLNAAIVAVLAKVVIHMISEVMLFFKGWRAKSQLKEWEESSSTEVKSSSPLVALFPSNESAEERFLSPSEETATPLGPPRALSAEGLPLSVFGARSSQRRISRVSSHSPHGRGTGGLSSRRPARRLVKLDSVAAWRVSIANSSTDTSGGAVDLRAGVSSRSIPPADAAEQSGMGMSRTYTHVTVSGAAADAAQPAAKSRRRAKRTMTPKATLAQAPDEGAVAAASQSQSVFGSSDRIMRKMSVRTIPRRQDGATRSPRSPGPKSPSLRKQLTHASDSPFAARFADPVTV